MRIKLTNEQIEALVAMVSLGQQDKSYYLDNYAEENEEVPEQIAEGRRQIGQASDALAIIRGGGVQGQQAGDTGDEDVATSLLTIIADFHVAGDPDDLRAPLERAVAVVLEDASNDGSFSVPGTSGSFLSAEVTTVFKTDKD